MINGIKKSCIKENIWEVNNMYSEMEKENIIEYRSKVNMNKLRLNFLAKPLNDKTKISGNIILWRHNNEELFINIYKRIIK